MLIDFDTVPLGISSRHQVDQLNAVYDRLTARLVDQIKMPEGKSGFRLSNLIRVYLQSHLRRMLQVTEGAFSSFFDGRGVVALMCARGLYESLAVVSDFEQDLMPILQVGDLDALFTFTKNRVVAARAKRLIALTSQAVSPKNIITMVDKLKSIRAKIPEEYDFLSEIAHPNGVGAVGFFADMRNPEDVAYFSDSGPDVHADLQWVFVASYLLSNYEALMNRVEALLPALTAAGEAGWPARQ